MRAGESVSRQFLATFAHGREVHDAPKKARHVCERRRDGEQLSLISSNMMYHLPWLSMFEYGVEDRQQLAHARDEGGRNWEPQPVFRSLQQLVEAVWRESSDRGITPFVSQGSAFLQQRGRVCVERQPCPGGTCEDPHNFRKSQIFTLP